METAELYEQIAYEAKLAAQAGNWPQARAAWVRALELFPAGSDEYRTAQTRIANIDAQMASAAREGVWQRRLYKLGPLGVFLWKFKTLALIALTKGKVLLFGLGKLQTFISMFVSLGFYTVAYGWKFALGLVLSIYIHEMGHVVQLRKYGIAATSPMFIPFFGAFIRMKSYPANASQDARTGLAGPIWGLGAAAFAWVVATMTGAPIWFAIARAGAWINLFNLIPIWQLDGGRGFRALTRSQRVWALGVALVMWAVTEESMLLFISMGALYRCFSKDYPEDPDRVVLLQYAGLLALLSMLVMMSA